MFLLEEKNFISHFYSITGWIDKLFFIFFVFAGILHYEIKEMIQKIQLLQKETQEMNGELVTGFGLGLMSSNDHSPIGSSLPNNEINNANNDSNNSRPAGGGGSVPVIRPTELIPVHTLVTNVGGSGQTAITTTAASADITNIHKQLTQESSTSCSYQMNHVSEHSGSQLIHSNNTSRQTAI